MGCFEREPFPAMARRLARGTELFHGLRVLALDGILLAVPDPVDNPETFGKRGSQRSPMVKPSAEPTPDPRGLAADELPPPAPS
ncbi:hypothetical protein ACFYXH_23650 [Streptomyces sp. NPDC002730]|uniref:hypothetical protein n=1 Tax=Streptomyces sp. NPDC002730 TaxID=3364662 RepID=UPI003686DFE1